MHSLAWTENAFADVLCQYKPTCDKETCLVTAGLCCKTGVRLSTDSLKCNENAIREQQQHVPYSNLTHCSGQACYHTVTAR